MKDKYLVWEGQVWFRLLCPIWSAGGLIGHSGSVIKKLEIETSAKIHVEDAVGADSGDRVVYVVGSDAVEKTVTFLGECFQVSVGQEALLRVYDRILQVDTNTSDAIVRCCRLLAQTNQIRALIGTQGNTIHNIRKHTGACIRVLNPPLPYPSDELIQITGDTIAVKKALLAVSKCLQENPPKHKASPVFTTSPSLPYPSRDSPYVEVVFKMLCSSDLAGSIIGKGGSLVKTMQEETGASIHFATSLPGCHERVVTISSIENVESQQSPAQNAVLRVFARSIGADTKSGHVSKWNNGEVVTARLQIPSNQAGCLIGVRGTIVSDLQKVTGTRIQVLEGNHLPLCASSDERVVQIAGDHVNVQNALVEISRRLRERIFSSKGLNVVQTSSASYPVGNFVPLGRVKDGAISNFSQASNFASSRNGTHTLEHRLEELNISQDINGHMPPKFPHQNFTRASVTTHTGPAELVDGERSAATVTNMTFEVVIPENIFSSVFDNDGEKLARLREISGAKIEVQYPSPGNEGKVIISGTPNETLSGRSILQLYIVSAK